MTVQDAKLFILNFVNGAEDDPFLKAIAFDLEVADDGHPFNAYIYELCQHRFPHHHVSICGHTAKIYNIADIREPIALICNMGTPPVTPCEKRWTRDELKAVKRCYPNKAKWGHLRRTLKRRTWEEIEEKGLDYLGTDHDETEAEL